MSDDASAAGLILGIGSALGLSVTPIIVAVVSRLNGIGKGSSRADDDAWIPREKYDHLLDDYERSDAVNERLDRDLKRAYADIDRARARAEDAEDELAYLKSGRTGPRRTRTDTPPPDPDRRIK